MVLLAGAVWAFARPEPSTAYHLAGLLATLLAAAAGGYVTGTVSRVRPVLHAGALAVILVALTSLDWSDASAGSPVWSLAGATLLAGLGALVGGWVRLRRGPPRTAEDRVRDALSDALDGSIDSHRHD